MLLGPHDELSSWVLQLSVITKTRAARRQILLLRVVPFEYPLSYMLGST